MHDRPPGGEPGPLLLTIWIVAAALAVAAPAAAQTVPAAADTVVSVTVTGNVTVDEDLIVRGFGLRPGGRYSTDGVRRGIRRLYDLGFFTDIAVEGGRVDGGIALALRVVENPRVAALELSGADHFKRGKIEEITGPVVGRLADDRLLAQIQRRLERAYTADGYTRAEVRPRYLPAASDTRRILFLEIDEGKKMRVEKIRFAGIRQADPDDLRGAMEQGTTGFLRKGIYKPALAESDENAVEAELANLGFRDGRVTGRRVLPGSEDDHLIVEIEIDEGPRYYVGSVRWEGNEVMATPFLYRVTRLEPGEVFSQGDVGKTEEEAYGLYAERGYIYLTIRPDYATRDSTVDVTFRVLEGEPSRVRDIVISGNTRTKERVIRRQLAIRPGDLFRRNALIRSQRELHQLGYFSNLELNSRPVPDSNDIDLLLAVEERQVGTASAGFGFSSSVGLTGFMELGHSNLFGNGQSINLRMERGGTRNNAEVSFTEPWFLGTPTSVGADLFSTNRVLRGRTVDLEVRRAGGALRLGRPLPLAYTRIFATYRLETQSVIDESTSDVADTTGESSQFFVTGFQLDQDDALTSSFSLRLSRNSTDHPLYPTVGSIANLSGEMIGGPLGGDQVLQKYEFDYKRYARPVDLGGFRPVLMFRPRAGVIGDAFRDDPLYPERIQVEDAIPQDAVADTAGFPFGGSVLVPIASRHYREFPPETNELFRLGGTSFDPLRGYDDFEIVPRDNVTRRFIVIKDTSIDSTGAEIVDYRTDSDAIFFPGGRYMLAFTTEWQFSIADPLHGLFFFDVGGTWNEASDFRWDTLHRGTGFGLRMEVPLLGVIGFDYGYGFDQLDEATGLYNDKGWEPHLQFGRIF